MLISVIICTRNRAARLARVLNSLAECEWPSPEFRWEVIVVDNGSTDHTQDVVKRFSSSLPVRVICEERAGLSNARNCGVRAANGEWLLWTDDDATVDSRWLIAYESAMREHPSASVFGGPIKAHFEGSPPMWLAQGLAQVPGAFSELGPQDVPEVLSSREPVPYGANFALRRSVAQRFPFDVNLGRHPCWPMRTGEETTVIREILVAKEVGRWLPDACVMHHIDGQRQTGGYLRSYYYWHHRMRMMQRAISLCRRSLVKEMVYSFFVAATHEARQVAGLVFRSRQRQVQELSKAGIFWGRAAGALRALLDLPS